MLQNLPQGGVFLHRHRWRFGGGLPNIEPQPPAKSEIPRPLARFALVRTGRIFHSMKRSRFAAALGALFGLFCGGLISPGWGQTPLPLPPPAPPVQGAAPLAPPGEEATEPLRGESPQRDFPRSGWRNLSPAQREAIRRLSREEREALLKRGGPRQGGAAPPGMRLSPQERRQLRDQIREEHERRGGGFGRGRRP